MTIDDDPRKLSKASPETRNGSATSSAKQRAGGGTALYDAIYVACEQLLQHAPAPTKGSSTDTRRVLVVISDDVDDNLSHHTRSEASENRATRRYRGSTPSARVQIGS